MISPRPPSLARRHSVRLTEKDETQMNSVSQLVVLVLGVCTYSADQTRLAGYPSGYRSVRRLEIHSAQSETSTVYRRAPSRFDKANQIKLLAIYNQAIRLVVITRLDSKTPSPFIRQTVVSYAAGRRVQKRDATRCMEDR